MDPAVLFYRFGVSLVIGLLVGMQREYSFAGQKHHLFAGVRTYPLLAVGGCAAAFLYDLTGEILTFLIIFGLLGGMILIAYFLSGDSGDIGMTTEASAVLVMVLGALVYWEQFEISAAIAVAMAVLLSLKSEFRGFTRALTREDVVATLKFAVITVIVLPVLPDEPIGPPPFDVITLYRVWLMVVFISGIGFLGYVLIKVVGQKQGIGLTGLLGGLASSTAVTLSFTERSKERPDLAKPFALAIIAAWTVMFVRVFITVGVLNNALLSQVWLPLAVSMGLGLGYGVYLYFSQKTDEDAEVTFSNPFDLRPAINFGIIYAIVLVVSNAALLYFGTRGVYVSSVLAGLADVDAIAISMAQLSATGGMDMETASRAVVLAAMANTLSKGVIAMSWGAKEMRRSLLPGVLLMLAGGLGVAFLF